MNFINKLKEVISEEKVPFIFNRDDLLKEFSKSEVNNISNYDFKNSASSNKNKKVLYSRIIDRKTFYVIKGENL